MDEILVGSLNEEIRNGFLVSEKRKAVWNVELCLLKRLDEVCKKYNLRYWLDGGSLLGAVRHKCFIPWDDDIDVVMPRKDYDKLSEISKLEFCYPYFYQDIYSENNYPGIHSKIRDCRTTAISKNWLFNDINQGIFIDIFPMDGVPDSKQEFDMLSKIAYKKAKTIRFYYEYERVLSLNLKVRKKLKERKVISRKSIGAGLDYVNAFREYENMFKQYDYETSKNVAPIAFTLETQRQVSIDHACYEDTLFWDFEKMLVPIPIGYDAILRTYYGSNYMIPKNCSIFNSTIYFDPFVAYKVHLEKLRKEYSLFNRYIKEFCSVINLNVTSEYECKLLTI